MLRKAELTGDETAGYGIRLDSKAPLGIEVTLLEQRKHAENMVFVPGGQYGLVGGGRPTGEAVELDDFFIDRFEVTNHEYREFVDAGGYADPEVLDARVHARRPRNSYRGGVVVGGGNRAVDRQHGRARPAKLGARTFSGWQG